MLIQMICWSLAIGCTALGGFDLYLLLSEGSRLDAWVLETTTRFVTFWTIMMLGLAGMLVLWWYFLPDWWQRGLFPKLTRFGVAWALLSQPYGALIFYYFLYTPRQHYKPTEVRA